MKKIFTLAVLMSVIGGLFISQLHARDEALTVKVIEPYAYATTKVQKNGAIFGRFENTGDADIHIISAETPIADRVELHTSGMDEGGDMMMMREVERLSFKAGETFTLKPNGYHIMLFGLKKQLNKGESFPVTLFSDQDMGITFAAEVKNPSDIGEDIQNEVSE